MRTERQRVGVVTLNRPKQLNALNNQLMDELGAALKALTPIRPSGCMVVTGTEKAFAARRRHRRHGDYSFCRRLQGRLHHPQLGTIRSVRKPVIAAVSGFALGGGCELAA